MYRIGNRLSLCCCGGAVECCQSAGDEQDVSNEVKLNQVV